MVTIFAYAMLPLQVYINKYNVFGDSAENNMRSVEKPCFCSINR